MYMYMYPCICIHECMHTYVRTYVRTYIHTHSKLDMYEKYKCIIQHKNSQPCNKNNALFYCSASTSPLTSRSTIKLPN